MCSGTACKAVVANSVRLLPQLDRLAKHAVRERNVAHRILNTIMQQGVVNVAASLGVAPPAPNPPAPPAAPPKGSSWFGIPVPTWFGDMQDAAAPAPSAVSAESVRVAIKSGGG